MYLINLKRGKKLFPWSTFHLSRAHFQVEGKWKIFPHHHRWVDEISRLKKNKDLMNFYCFFSVCQIIVVIYGRVISLTLHKLMDRRQQSCSFALFACVQELFRRQRLPQSEITLNLPRHLITCHLLWGFKRKIIINSLEVRSDLACRKLLLLMCFFSRQNSFERWWNLKKYVKKGFPI